MSEYLSKEEIKQWRSSLEKITLEEYAQRLGKKIEEEKQTNDLVDIVLNGHQDSVSNQSVYSRSKNERISAIAERAFEREQQISHTPFSIRAPKAPVETSNEEIIVKEVINNSKMNINSPKMSQEKAQIVEDSLREEVKITFKKALTDREQMVFDYFANNRGKVVYAKDLAGLLDLPRDYVYKYIKNLRAKIDGDNLKNAEAGGFVFSA